LLDVLFFGLVFSSSAWLSNITSAITVGLFEGVDGFCSLVCSMHAKTIRHDQSEICEEGFHFITMNHPLLSKTPGIKLTLLQLRFREYSEFAS
jgi:hypothetical protein